MITKADIIMRIVLVFYMTIDVLDLLDSLEIFVADVIIKLLLF